MLTAQKGRGEVEGGRRESPVHTISSFISVSCPFELNCDGKYVFTSGFFVKSQRSFLDVCHLTILFQHHESKLKETENERKIGKLTVCNSSLCYYHYYCIVAMLQLNGQIAFIYLSPATTICAMFLIECIKRRAPARAVFSSSNGKRIILLMSFTASSKRRHWRALHSWT